MAKAKAEKADENSTNLDAPPTMQPEIVTFEITGISPLLQNNPEKFIGNGGGEGLTVKKKYNDEEEAQLRLYPMDDGTYGHPTEAFLKSMVKAVSGRKFDKLFATSVIKGTVFVVEDRSIIVDENGDPMTEYVIDRRSVVIGKARILRCRPKWEGWCMRIALEIDVAICHPDNILESLGLAGRTVGVGDYRPGTGGGFGRFRVQFG